MRPQVGTTPLMSRYILLNRRDLWCDACRPMDDATLRSLLDALRASPDNAALRVTVVRMLHAKNDPRTNVYLDGLDPRGLAVADRAFVGRLLVDGGEPHRALAMLDGVEPEILVVRARVLHALKDQPAAVAAYEAAVKANP